MVYLAAVAPQAGEKPFAKLGKADEEAYFKGVAFDEKAGLMKIANKKAFIQTFTSCKKCDGLEGFATMSVDEPALPGDGISGPTKGLLSKLAKVYIYTQKDQIITLASQKNIAKGIKVQKTLSINTGHVPMVTNPELLAKTLKQVL